MERMERLNKYQKKIDELRPFEGEMLEQIKDFYRVSLTWSSNALEGNSLTESETKVVIEDGLTVGGKPLRDLFEAVDHAKAYDYIYTTIKNEEITKEDILLLHELFYKNIEREYAGKFRDIPVLISGSKYPVSNVEDVDRHMDELCEWMKNSEKELHPVVFAAMLHKKFVNIHPFKDGNGRVARLLMNMVLIRNGYIPVIISPIQRSEYINLLEKAHRDDSDFIDFIIDMEIESQKDFLRLMGISYKGI